MAVVLTTHKRSTHEQLGTRGKKGWELPGVLKSLQVGSHMYGHPEASLPLDSVGSQSWYWKGSMRLGEEARAWLWLGLYLVLHQLHSALSCPNECCLSASPKGLPLEPSRISSACGSLGDCGGWGKASFCALLECCAAYIMNIFRHSGKLK